MIRIDVEVLGIKIGTYSRMNHVMDCFVDFQPSQELFEECNITALPCIKELEKVDKNILMNLNMYLPTGSAKVYFCDPNCWHTGFCKFIELDLLGIVRHKEKIFKKIPENF